MSYVLAMSSVACEPLDTMCAVCNIRCATLSMKPLQMWSGSVALVQVNSSSWSDCIFGRRIELAID